MALHYYTYYSKEKIKIADKSFAVGGEGALFKIASSGYYRDKIAKIYHQHKDLSKIFLKIKFFIEQESTGLNTKMAFPTDLLMKDNQFVGFIMPILKGEKLELFCQPNRLEKTSIKWKRLNLHSSKGTENRLSVAFNIASLLANIHATQSYTVVDFKPENILINPHLDIAMVDIDSMQIEQQGRLLFRAPVVTVEYAPPEYHVGNIVAEQHFTADWDNFSLAIILYRVLFQVHPYAASSEHPYSNVVNLHGKVENGLFVHNPLLKDNFRAIPMLHRGFYDLPESLQELFLRCFVEGHNDPSKRPTALEWAIEILFCIKRYHNKDQLLERLTIGAMPELKLHRIPIPRIAYIQKELGLLEKVDDWSIQATLENLRTPVQAFSKHQSSAFLVQVFLAIYSLILFCGFAYFMYCTLWVSMQYFLESDYSSLIILFINLVPASIILLFLFFSVPPILSMLTTALLQTIFAPLFFKTHQTVVGMQKENEGKIPIADLLSQGKTLEAEMKLADKKMGRLLKKETQLYKEIVLLRTNANRQLEAAFDRGSQQLETLNLTFMSKASSALNRQDKKTLMTLAKTLQQEQYYHKLTQTYTRKIADIRHKYNVVQTAFSKQLIEAQTAIKEEKIQLDLLLKKRTTYLENQKKLAINFDEITVEHYLKHVWKNWQK